MKLKLIKKSILIVVSTLAISGVASANLGDTYKKSVARYGQPWKTGENGWVLWATDKDNTVNENFGSDGICRAIEYRRFTGVSYGQNELVTRISQNLPGGGSFSEIPVDLGRAWMTKDGAFTAVLVVEEATGQGRNPVMLSIWSPEMHRAVDAYDAAKAKAAAAAPSPAPVSYSFTEISTAELVRNSSVS